MKPKMPKKVLTAPVTERRKTIHVCQPHEHNTTKCMGCFSVFLQGEKSPNVINCKHPELTPLVIGTPWSYHLAWFFFCIFVGLVMFAWGYGPDWNRISGDHVMVTNQ